uniref:Uncharacterized protein n=1 Tax=Mycena chlorophos TaxID=658473 RepID=A0ABQ0KVM8_MYCCL|nr:predicted protein [Mycena chlorophos]
MRVGVKGWPWDRLRVCGCLRCRLVDAAWLAIDCRAASAGERVGEGKRHGKCVTRRPLLLLHHDVDLRLLRFLIRPFCASTNDASKGQPATPGLFEPRPGLVAEEELEPRLALGYDDGSSTTRVCRRAALRLGLALRDVRHRVPRLRPPRLRDFVDATTATCRIPS